MTEPLPLACRWALRRWGGRPTRYLLTVSVARQQMTLWELPATPASSQRSGLPHHYRMRRRYLVSTSAYGVGQKVDSDCTPLGLHRVAQKVGGGMPVGTVFRSRQPVGYVWKGLPHGTIVHRILWLEGLENGFNRGGSVDTFRRYVYIHGFGDETTLGTPNSHGCIHLAAADLMPLYNRIPTGTLVWIA